MMYEERYPVIGICEFGSLYMHEKICPTRRDETEWLVHMLMSLLEQLPSETKSKKSDNRNDFTSAGY